MYKYIIEGGHPLNGEVSASGAKNAVLPILFATLLTDEECVLRHVPDLRDIKTTFKLLECLGKQITYSRGTAVIRGGRKLSTEAPYDLVKQMRASVLVAGPLLARFGHASVPLPGGCAIGLRPVDIHLKGFAALGAELATVGGNMVLTGKKLSGCHFKLNFPSVGATQNLVMCAALLPGATVLDGVALEPENDDLYGFMRAMGAQVVRKNGRVFVNGVKKLHGATYTIMPDRIEAGTYLLAGAATRGRVTVKNCVPEHLRALLDLLVKAGAAVTETADSVTVDMKGRAPEAVNMETLPYPGFPTDLQAPWMAAMTVAQGRAKIKEAIFENRFMHAPELARMGALIAVHGNTALVDGAKSLSGASVMASDLRGGAALCVAALAARGRSEIQRVYHIERGYERINRKLAALGAHVRRVAA